jgi:hypothetical protein
MRLLVSFLLSVVIYLAIIFAFLNFLIVKKQKKEEVLIHTAILPVKTITNTVKKTKKNPKPLIKPKPKPVSKPKPKIKKKVKIGSKSSFTKGGNTDLKDLFKNVEANIPSTPVKFQKNLQMSRFKGNIANIEKNLNKVKMLSVNVQITQNSNNNISKENINKIINKIGEVWYQISNIPGQYAKIHIISNNGSLQVVILDSNLPEAQQIELINGIKALHFKQNFDLNILFRTKVSK